MRGMFRAVPSTVKRPERQEVAIFLSLISLEGAYIMELEGRQLMSRPRGIECVVQQYRVPTNCGSGTNDFNIVLQSRLQLQHTILTSAVIPPTNYMGLSLFLTRL